MSDTVKSGTTREKGFKYVLPRIQAADEDHRLRDANSLLLQSNSKPKYSFVAIGITNSSNVNLPPVSSLTEIISNSARDMLFNHTLAFFDVNLGSRETNILKLGEILCGTVKSPKVRDFQIP